MMRVKDLQIEVEDGELQLMRPQLARLMRRRKLQPVT